MEIEATFVHIYKNNLWGNDESVSGPGSTYAYTENLRRMLPVLMQQFSIKSIFDAPCGDLNWMKYLLNDANVDYVGGDIVLPLVESHRANFARENIRFVHIDLTKDMFPQTDLMICRDCLFHLSYRETLLVMQNFVDSKIKYLLTTTHRKSNRFQNADILTGGVRQIDLFAEPYNFPKDVLFRIEDWMPPYQEREMCLWSREQVIQARDALSNRIAQHDARNIDFGLTDIQKPQTSAQESARPNEIRAPALRLGAQGRTLEAGSIGGTTSMLALQDLQRRGYAPSTVLDIGAHLGAFAKSFLALFPACKPILIEPNPFCQDDLSKLGYERHAVAASNETGQASLYLTKEWLQSTGSSLYRENTHFFRDEAVIKRDVPKARIDDLFQNQRFDFVKIDTQGSELDVLRGGEEVLKQSDYILIEISLVEYNIGGARAEDVFAQLDAMGFDCAGVTEFHRLKSVKNGDLLQMDFLFENRRRRLAIAPDEARIPDIRTLAASLAGDGRAKDAILLLEHLAAIKPDDCETLRPLAKLLGVSGRTLDSLEALSKLRNAAADPADVLTDIQENMAPAIENFNRHLSAGEIGEAERYAAALAILVPGNPAILNAALSCNLALNRLGEVQKYQAALKALDAGNAALPASNSSEDDVERRVSEALSESTDHPLLKLRNMHDAMSAILTRPLGERSGAQIEKLLAAARALEISVPPDSEWAAWEKHYRAMVNAADIGSVYAQTPQDAAEAHIEFATSDGAALTWDGIRERAAPKNAKCVFFAAADRHYVDLYARWYIKSILKHCDVPCLVIVHVIGGAGQLDAIAASAGIRDERLIFAADSFDAETVTTACYDSPPKGRIEKPVAHFQSVRFLRLNALLRELNRPVFVSDIDLLLQRGVADLLERCTGDDVVFNENTASAHAGSRITANLVLVNPTANAGIFLRYLRSYLEGMLAKPEVSRWIDQFALLLARHHLSLKGNAPRIGYFDTEKDINNVMFPSYQENPFRFLSLYHGFDLNSLEDTPRAEEEPANGRSLAA